MPRGHLAPVVDRSFHVGQAVKSREVGQQVIDSVPVDIPHNGIDFAGKEGSNVLAVAAGVVTWVGRESGYGNTVEVSHGDGFVTRYSHNKQNLVAPGDLVRKGEPIALVGSTGRSTALSDGTRWSGRCTDS